MLLRTAVKDGKFYARVYEVKSLETGNGEFRAVVGSEAIADATISERKFNAVSAILKRFAGG